jgi:hypothetical protein
VRERVALRRGRAQAVRGAVRVQHALRGVLPGGGAGGRDGRGVGGGERRRRREVWDGGCVVGSD